MPTERRRLSVDIEEEAFDGWDYATRVYGGDKRALAEVIGLELAQLEVPFAKLPPHWRRWFREAEARRVESNKNRGRPRRP